MKKLTHAHDKLYIQYMYINACGNTVHVTCTEVTYKMSRSQLKDFITALAFIILPSTVGCVVVATTDTTNVRYFNRVANAFFNFNSVGTRFYKSRIKCIAACKQRDDCGSVNMKRAAAAAGDLIECDFQQRATRTEAKIEIEDDTTYYCKSVYTVYMTSR